MGTKLVDGPMAGRIVLGISASREGETFTIGTVSYRATGRRTACDHWEAKYVTTRKERKR